MFDDLFDNRIDFLGQVWTTSYHDLPNTVLNTTRTSTDLVYLILRDQLQFEASETDQEIHWPPEGL